MQAAAQNRRPQQPGETFAQASSSTRRSGWRWSRTSASRFSGSIRRFRTPASLWRGRRGAPNVSTTLTTPVADDRRRPARCRAARPASTTAPSRPALGLTQTLPWGAQLLGRTGTTRGSRPTNLFSTLQPAAQLEPERCSSRSRCCATSRSTRFGSRSRSARSRATCPTSSSQGVVTQTLRNVRNAYWDLAYAIDNLKAQQESLALSQQSLKDNQKRVEIGTMAPIDIVQAQAEVATNESSVIVAEAAIKAAQDNLRALILDPATPDFWNVALRADRRAGVRRARDRPRRRGAQRARQAVRPAGREERARAERHQHQVTTTTRSSRTSTRSVDLRPDRRRRHAAQRRSTSRTSRPASRRTATVGRRRGFGSVLGDVFQSAYPHVDVRRARSAIRSARTPRTPTSRG